MAYTHTQIDLGSKGDAVALYVLIVPCVPQES